MTTTTKVLAILSSLGALISAGLLISTWFAQSIIIEKAKDHAMESIRPRLEPVVKFLEAPKLMGKLPSSVEEKLRNELTDYQSDPKKWLLEISQATGERAGDFEFPEIKNPLARKGLDLLARNLSGAREHFRKSYNNLILDVRIFCGTNVVALLLATWLLVAARSPQMRHWLGAWSIVVLISTAFWTDAYLHQSWTWSILFNDYFGWSYATFHALTAVYLFLRIEPMLQANSPAEDVSR